MLAAAEQFKLEQRPASIAVQPPVAGGGSFQPALSRHRSVQRAAPGHLTGYQSQIVFFHSAGHELAAQSACGPAALGKEYRARGAGIETVHGGGAEGQAPPFQPVADPFGEIVRFVPGAAVYRQPGRFVNGQEIRALQQDLDPFPLRLLQQFAEAFAGRQGQHIAGLQQVLPGCGTAVEPYPAFAQQILHEAIIAPPAPAGKGCVRRAKGWKSSICDAL